MPGTKNSGGRNRKTQAEHALGGTVRDHRHADVVDVDVPKGRPTPPEELAGEALAEWNRMVARLELANTLSLVDDAVLYRYCQLHARADRLERQVAQLPSAFILDHMGNEKVHPGFAQLRSYDLALRGYLVEFGMTPSARTRVKPNATPNEGDGFDEFNDKSQQRNDQATH